MPRDWTPPKAKPSPGSCSCHLRQRSAKSVRIPPMLSGTRFPVPRSYRLAWPQRPPSTAVVGRSSLRAPNRRAVSPRGGAGWSARAKSAMGPRPTFSISFCKPPPGLSAILRKRSTDRACSQGRAAPRGRVTIGRQIMRWYFVPPAQNDGSAFANHLTLVWAVAGHTYAYGFHVVSTLAQAKALDLELVRHLTVVRPHAGRKLGHLAVGRSGPAGLRPSLGGSSRSGCGRWRARSAMRAGSRSSMTMFGRSAPGSWSCGRSSGRSIDRASWCSAICGSRGSTSRLGMGSGVVGGW